MRAILYDHQPLFRQALADLVRQIDPKADVKTVDFKAAGDMAELSALSGAAGVDLLAIGWPDSGADPIDDWAALRSRFAKAAIVVVAARCSRSDCEAWIRQGASGVILRSDAPDLILSALRLVLQGGTFLPSARTVDARADFDYPAPLPGQRIPKGVAESKLRPALTPRQVAVLRLMGRGWSNRQIAKELSVSEGTVKVHVNAILRTLGVSNRTQAALAANRSGL